MSVAARHLVRATDKGRAPLQLLGSGGARRGMAEAAQDADETKRKRDYLRTMLGKDMAGERYLTRLVSEATAHQQKLASSQHGAAAAPFAAAAVPPPAPAAPAAWSKGGVALSSQYFSVPVVSIKWKNSSAEELRGDVEAALATMAANDCCFLDFAGVTSEDDCSANVVKAVKEQLLSSPKAVNVLGAVNCLDHIAQRAAKSAGLALVNLRSRGTNAPQQPQQPSSSSSSMHGKPSSTEKASKPQQSVAAMIHYGAVRSGQQIYAEGSSLIVVGSVNDGAEVLADGDIHVYGALKGRAMAGLGGSADARVFAHFFAASLVGIADAFAMPDDCPALGDLNGKAVSVRLLKKGESGNEGGGGSDRVVECSGGKSLLVSILPLKDV